MATESDGCEMPQSTAARVNPCTWQTARKYLIWGKSMAIRFNAGQNSLLTPSCVADGLEK
jgi:hypothetical protein